MADIETRRKWQRDYRMRHPDRIREKNRKYREEQDHPTDQRDGHESGLYGNGDAFPNFTMELESTLRLIQ